MVVGEGIELILVFVTIALTYVVLLAVERLTKHEGPPGKEPPSGARES